MADFIEVRTALPSQEDANKIAQRLVTERLQDESIFVPGNYVYLRMKRVIDHHLEHAQELD